MSFKSITNYTNEKYNGVFVLPDDGATADVVFLYQSIDDVLIGGVHYIKTPDYTGYVQCTDAGCPACSKGIRIQTKMFIPLFNITNGKIEFFERNNKFISQLQNDVFNRYPNPSEFVFRITRRGVAGSIDTRYEIRAIGHNVGFPYDKILSDNHIVFPDCYESRCKTVDNMTLSTWLSNSSKKSSFNSDSNSDLPYYTPTPRVTTTPAYVESSNMQAYVSVPDTDIPSPIDSFDDYDPNEPAF